MDELTVLDLFCGAGGFSEGFRQQGFTIVMGIDHWKPAIDTFNHNFDLDCKVQNMLDYLYSTEKIEALPDTTVIIGSPPCVSFSNSNRSGKADKSLGLQLIKAFLRIIAVKKHQPGSQLQAWFMENVTKSIAHLAPVYTFRDLDLDDWARAHRKRPSSVAIAMAEHSVVINSADYGSPQARKRAISGNIIRLRRLVVPPATHREPGDLTVPQLPVYRTLGLIREHLPSPNAALSNRQFADPLYPGLNLSRALLTDHFYDTGLYGSEWRNSMHLKINHPYMGIMSFPENENKPSRTITATKIGTSREAIIYRSEYGRNGDGEFRTPTVREAATLMSFPASYQFLGSEGAKWRLAGNAVCPSVGRNFAATVRSAMGLPPITEPLIRRMPKLKGVKNLNTFQEALFNDPPVRNKGSRFRRHPFKDGNITVTLSNYDITNTEETEFRWMTSVQYGNGDGFPTMNFEDEQFRELEPIIRTFPNGQRFIEVINNGFSERIADATRLQSMYEQQQDLENYLEPTRLIERLAAIIELYAVDAVFEQQGQIIFPNKRAVPQRQVMALYGVNKIATVANTPEIH
ncbi:hypothetical protein GCM10023149_28800 [Mucilaginibacter gynuensis]|uniref:DNA (cytosine-5-)-methyltransferase n=1 Tax=Mucilaginibacter gynuensis TaxID=1302236 RepID=A0ABP8GLE6_9SPHI